MSEIRIKMVYTAGIILLLYSLETAILGDRGKLGNPAVVNNLHSIVDKLTTHVY